SDPTTNRPARRSGSARGACSGRPTSTACCRCARGKKPCPRCRGPGCRSAPAPASGPACRTPDALHAPGPASRRNPPSPPVWTDLVALKGYEQVRASIAAQQGLQRPAVLVPQTLRSAVDVLPGASHPLGVLQEGGRAETVPAARLARSAPDGLAVDLLALLGELPLILVTLAGDVDRPVERSAGPAVRRPRLGERRLLERLLDALDELLASGLVGLGQMCWHHESSP